MNADKDSLALLAWPWTWPSGSLQAICHFFGSLACKQTCMFRSTPVSRLTNVPRGFITLRNGKDTGASTFGALLPKDKKAPIVIRLARFVEVVPRE